MEIDTSGPDGNIFTALSIATRFMQKTLRADADIKALREAVMSADSYKAACEAITEATLGSITFTGPEED